MREIKFRAWDLKNETMCKVNNINFENKKVSIEADSGDHENRHTATREFKEVAIMQYTGLKDINEVEIYEGDIVQSDDYLYLVGFNDFIDSDDFNMPQDQIGFYLFDIHEEGTYPFYRMAYQVISNIYKNPELLEG